MEFFTEVGGKRGNLITEMIGNEFTAWQDPTAVGIYHRTRGTIAAIYFLVKIVSEGPELIVKFLKKSGDAQDFLRKFTNPDVAEKLSHFDPEVNSQFLDDFRDLDVHADFDAKPGMVDGWKGAKDNGVDDIIRKDTDFLEVLDKFPYNTGKKKILDEATDADWSHILSGKLVDVPDQNPALSAELRTRFGSSTKTSKKFDTDPSRKEFDAITDDLIIEHKYSTSTISLSSAKRTQMKYQMKSCKTLGKNNYLIREGTPNDDWVNKAIEYANQFQVNTKIELNGVLLHNITF